MTGPASTAIFGVNDSPNWIGNVPAAGTRYRLNGWVRSASAGGSSRLHLREYLNGVRVGASGYFSNSVKLSPSWTLLYEDYVAQSTGSTLDLQVEDVPLAG